MTGSAKGPGILFAVVGASGAGKDSVLRGAHKALRDDDRFVFPQRFITRPAESGGEDHVAVTASEFGSMRDQDRFCLHWSAHGLSYGVPSAVIEYMDAGRHVIVNLSRTAIGDAIARFDEVAIVEISASPEVIRQRLKTRGRESAIEIDRRSRRRVEGNWALGSNVMRIKNDGTVEEAVARFVEAVTNRAEENAAIA